MLLLFGSTRLHAQQSVPMQYTYQIADTLRLRSKLEFLADSSCMGRATGTKAMSKVTIWLNQRFKDMGLAPIGNNYIHHFYTETGPIGRNVIGMIPSGKAYCTSYTIVMAHYDGIGKINDIIYPGADSNASGVVGMLTLAEMFTTMRKFSQHYDGNIIFVATDGKDLNMTGAENLYYLLHDLYLRDPFNGEMITLDRISLVVNLDQIGSTMSPLSSAKPEYLIMLGNESLKKEYQNVIKLYNFEHGFHLDLGFDYYGSKNFTDTFYRRVGEQKFFVEDHIPAVMFTSGITMNNNKPYDNVGSLDLEVLKKRILLIFHWLETLVPAPQR